MSQFLMEGHVYHARSETAENSFKYPIFNLYFCVDNEDSLKILLQKKFFRFLSFKSQDYFAVNDRSSFSSKARKFLSEKLDYQAESIFLQTIPRMFGYAFNPVNFWYCFKSGRLDAVLCEVNNTFGETHFYWLYNQGRDLNDQWLKADKKFHVSPFFDIEGSYRFRFVLSPARLHVDIQFLNADGSLKLNTWVHGTLKPLAETSLIKIIFKYGWLTPLVVLRIHYQAIKLFLKKVKFYKKPKIPQKEVTYGSTFIRR